MDELDPWPLPALCQTPGDLELKHACPHLVHIPKDTLGP